MRGGRVPVIVEKPIGDCVEAATRLVEAGKAARVPVLTGHHRNYGPITARAREKVRGGALGSVVAVIGTALFTSRAVLQAGRLLRGRRQLAPPPGRGPILLNLIHGVTTCCRWSGTSSGCRRSPRTRPAAVRWTTPRRWCSSSRTVRWVCSCCPTRQSPRSWEQTSQENKPKPTPAYADEDCYHIAGTRGSLSVPTLPLRVYGGKASWCEPLNSSVA